MRSQDHKNGGPEKGADFAVLGPHFSGPQKKVNFAVLGPQKTAVFLGLKARPLFGIRHIGFLLSITIFTIYFLSAITIKPTEFHKNTTFITY
jgi:hypothetical protein